MREAADGSSEALTDGAYGKGSKGLQDLRPFSWLENSKPADITTFAMSDEDRRLHNKLLYHILLQEDLAYDQIILYGESHFGPDYIHVSVCCDGGLRRKQIYHKE